MTRSTSHLVRMPMALLTLAVTPLAAPAPARAQTTTTPAILREIGIDQKLDEQVPLDIPFRDEAGREVRLGDYFGKKPVILTLVYFKCPMLCTLVLNGVVQSLSNKDMKFSIGREFDVLTVSFDPREGPELAAIKRDNYLKQYDRPGAAAGWHFLTGNAESIRRLTSAVGFRYVWDEKTQQFAHASGIFVLTGEGRVARYFYGIDYPARDLQFAVMDASKGKIGSKVDQLLLYCYCYDPVTGKYGLAIANLIRILGALTVLAIGGFIVISLRRERRHRTQAQVS
jgi:protein SCO1